MKIVLGTDLDDEFKQYLMNQDGIADVDISVNGFISEVYIKFDKIVALPSLLKWVLSFQDNEYSCILTFDKQTKGDFNILKYIVDDMCCEYCYSGLLEELFKNEHIKSVKSNFDFREPAFDIELIIEYDKDYSKDELIKYIKQNV